MTWLENLTEESYMELFKEDLIKINYFALDKKSCLSEMVEYLAEKGVINSYEDFFRAIMERENIMSTGIGKGIAIPHARHKVVNEFRILVYMLDNELDFEAIDEQPVKLIFMIAVPEEKKEDYMKVLSSLSNFLRVENNRKKLLNSTDKNELLKILKEIEL
jgi:fructose-specific phosphotransferase system IIA component